MFGILIRNKFLQGVIVLLVFIAALALYGDSKYRAGARDLATKIELARKDAINERATTDTIIRNLDDTSLVDRALEWVR